MHAHQMRLVERHGIEDVTTITGVPLFRPRSSVASWRCGLDEEQIEVQDMVGDAFEGSIRVDKTPSCSRKPFLESVRADRGWKHIRATGVEDEYFSGTCL